MNRSSCKRRSLGAGGKYHNKSSPVSSGAEGGLDTVKQRLTEEQSHPGHTFISRTLHGSLRRKKVKKCDSSASISSTDSFEWDERRRTISANIKRKLGTGYAKRPALPSSPDNFATASTVKESLICQFPDGTEEIVAAIKGRTLREMLSPIFDRRSLSMSEYAVFFEHSATPLRYDFDTFHMAGRTLVILGNHYDATNEFTYSTNTVQRGLELSAAAAAASTTPPPPASTASSQNNQSRHSTDSAQARSLHDEMSECPSNLSSGELSRMKRCNSLEDDQIVRRTVSDRDSEYSEPPGLTAKAKSISEQLERIRGSLPDPCRGLPRLEYATLDEILPESVLKGLAQSHQKDQQYLIWELITTEHNHLKLLSTMINTFKEAVVRLQADGFLTKLDRNTLFLNIEQIREIHLSFWDQCCHRLVETVKETGDPLDVEILATCQCALFEKEDNPLFEYCTQVLASKDYIKSRGEKSAEFRDFLEWSDNYLRMTLNNKLGMESVLIMIIQRIQKYPIILENILKKTTDESAKMALHRFYTKVNQFVKSLDLRMEEKEEQRKIAGVKERIESYNAVTVHSSHVNEQIQQALDKYNKFELTDLDPVLRKQRRFILETSCKMVALAAEHKPSEVGVVLFLFSDHILITKQKSAKKRSKIIKQPLTLDRVMVEEMREQNNTILLAYLNEYGNLLDIFMLHSSNVESHIRLLNDITAAKDRYEEDKKRMTAEVDRGGDTEVDSGGGPSSGSVDAAAAFLACPRLATTTNITRSSSEHYPPSRRATTEPSVARVQSMPASNEKRAVLHPQPGISSSSSASSSISGSSASVASEHSIASTSDAGSTCSKSAGTLSEIKETEKPSDDGNESDEATIKGNVIDSVKKLNDNFINLDINKDVPDSALDKNMSTHIPEKDLNNLIFSSSDT